MLPQKALESIFFKPHHEQDNNDILHVQVGFNRFLSHEVPSFDQSSLCSVVTLSIALNLSINTLGLIITYNGWGAWKTWNTRTTQIGRNSTIFVNGIMCKQWHATDHKDSTLE